MDCSIVFIPTPLKNPISGGEEYNLKLLDFLKREFGKVEPIEISLFRMGGRRSHQIFFFAFTSILRNFLYLLKIIKMNGAKIIILEDNYYSTDLFLFNFLLRRIKKSVNVVPIVHHLYYPLGEQGLYRILMRAIETVFLNHADWIITNSESTENDVKELLKREKASLVAYPGIGREKIAIRDMNSYDRKNRGILNILTVGSVGERKDYETLLRAVKLLVERCSEVNFSVDIIGNLKRNEEFPARILETVNSLSLSDYVVFRGWVENGELRDFYARADMFVSTSLHEGFGMAIAEAMCNRLPVIAANCGAVPYLVEDGVSGFLVPPRDYVRLAEKMELLLGSEELRRKMGANGFCEAKKFDWERTFRKIREKLLEAT